MVPLPWVRPWFGEARRCEARLGEASLGAAGLAWQ